MTDRVMEGLTALAEFVTARHKDDPGSKHGLSVKRAEIEIERLRAAVAAQAAQPATLTFPTELTDDLRDVLSMMLWHSGPIAHLLRAAGNEIKTRAEDEQAHVLHWLVCLALKHGSGWRAKASEQITEIRDTLRKSATPASNGGDHAGN